MIVIDVELDDLRYVLLILACIKTGYKVRGCQ